MKNLKKVIRLIALMILLPMGASSINTTTFAALERYMHREVKKEQLDVKDDED